MDKRIVELADRMAVLYKAFSDTVNEMRQIYRDLEDIMNTPEPEDMSTWCSPDQVANLYNISRQTVDRRLNEMEELEPRYSGCIIREHKCVRVQLRAYDDYRTNRDRLLNPRLRKSVPAYFRHL